MTAPLVLTPQHFGSLVFERASSRYLPFDAGATAILRELTARSFPQLMSRRPPAEQSWRV